MGRRSSVIVGRDTELRSIRDALDAARSGRGGAVFLVGESGIGKSRLAVAAADLAFAADMRLLRGRGSVIGPMVPFRSLTEALLSLLRAGEDIDVEALGPYRSILARLIPDWGEPPSTQDGASVVILAEAVLRLTGIAGQDRGCLMTLDDLQDADAETLAVVEYLIDNLEQQPVLLIGTIRSEQCPALQLARSAAQRGTGVVIELDRLDQDDLRLLAASCLGMDVALMPEPAAELLWAGSAGNPFLAEELLTGMVDGGLLVPHRDAWQVSEAVHSQLPATFARTLARRVEQLDPRARELLSVAAVLGSRFPLAVLRTVTGLTDRDLLSYLHGQLAAQLITPDEPDWYAFRHRLIREVLLTMQTLGERAEVARQVADAMATVYPGLPGEWCQVSATLRVEAGDPAAGGRLFADAGRRALAQGAAHSAVTLLDRALELLPAGDAAARSDALETLLYALAEAGLVERALAGVGVLDQAGNVDRRRRARLHTRLAWAATVAGRSSHGLAQVVAARALLGEEAAAEDTAPIDIIEAHLVLDTTGHEQLRTAELLARRAATVAEAAPLPEVACQAWQLLGAVIRGRDPDEATACLDRARAIAVQHNLPIWEIHALVRLGNDDALREGNLDRLEQARRQASTAGAMTARYLAETTIALHTVLRGDFAGAESLLDGVVAATSRLKLLETTQQALLVKAILAGHQGRRREMDRAVAEFRHWKGDDQPQFGPRLHGLAAAFCALLEEDRERAVLEQRAALSAEEMNPTTMQLSGRYGLHLLLRAMSGEVSEAEFEALTAAPASGLRWDRQFALFAGAVLAGRAGRSDEAVAAVAEALRVGEPYVMGRHLGLRLVGEAALGDGWGSPVDWLRTTEEHFHSADVPAVASACRGLLRRTGTRLTQRRNGAAEIPASLRTAGVTVREYEVLRLLVERLGNREIADRLHLSPRTVERHVSSLIAKTGLPNRVALSRLAATSN